VVALQQSLLNIKGASAQLALDEAVVEFTCAFIPVLISCVLLARLKPRYFTHLTAATPSNHSQGSSSGEPMKGRKWHLRRLRVRPYSWPSLSSSWIVALISH
jgi:hypothetical protein